jgi:16S rRNA (guanine527-N7)-methyltransferase
MKDARIAELLAPFLGDSPQPRGHEGPARAVDGAVLSPGQLRYISIYIDLLIQWNARINLTAVHQPEEIVTRHFGESIFAARHLFPKAKPGTDPTGSKPWSTASAPHVIDVGSGSGFPGLPIKIWAPQVRLTLIESNQKKATFLREVIRSLKLTDAEVFAGRAEAFSGSGGEIVTLRAVEHFESILPVVARMLRSSGCLALMVGEAQVGGIRKGLPSLKWAEAVRLPLSDNRVLIIGSKEP